MAHVHGIGFRIVGESFAALPSAQRVTLSGFSQRNDPATGQVRDDYLYSVSVERHDWERIDFSALEMIDIVESLAQFELRLQMTKTGILTTIHSLCANTHSPGTTKCRGFYGHHSNDTT